MAGTAGTHPGFAEGAGTQTIYNRPAMAPGLILNADDFGLTRGINRGIVELHGAGALSSATLMANGPAFEDAVELAHTHPELGVGCHLVFVDGLPVSHPEAIPTLLGADGKHFRPSVYDFAQALLRGTVRAEDVAREAQAQIQKLQRAGIDVTHVDTHKHAHVFPAVLDPVLHIAQRCGVRAIRNPFEPRWSSRLARGSIARGVQLRALRRFEPGFLKAIQSAGAQMSTPSGTLGMAATGTLTEERLRAMFLALARLPEDGQVLELCCHPGYGDAMLDAARTRLRGSREVELRALLRVVPGMLAEPGAPRLVHFGELGIAGLQRASGHFTPSSGYERIC